MMNFNQTNDKISANGYRRNATARKMYDDAGNLQLIYDYEHRKKLDMFSVYTDEFGAVLYVEFTKVSFNPQTRKFSQQVHRVNDMKELMRFLA
jgi:hypothetical protein